MEFRRIAAPFTLVLLTVALASAPVSADLYLAPSAANAKNVSVDCFAFLEWQNGFTGFAETPEEVTTNHGPPCAPQQTDCGCGITDYYCWIISRSSTDPFDNVGPLATNVLYLWIEYANSFHGFTAAEFGFAGSHAVEDLVLRNGFRNAGTVTEPLLLPPTCLYGRRFLVAELHVSNPVSVEPSTWGAVKGAYR